MNRFALVLMFVLPFGGAARADDAPQQEAEPGFTTEVVNISADPRDTLACGKRPLQLVIKRQANAGASEQAYADIVAAISRRARADGITVVDAGQDVPAATVKAEFDTWFYVAGQKLNPNFVHLADYMEFKLNGTPMPELKASGQTWNVDVIRVAAGVLGFARGWLPTSFAGSMMAHGVMDGRGPGLEQAEDKRLGDPERLALGLRRVVTEVRVDVDGQTMTFQVHAIRAAAAPTSVEAMAEATWRLALQILAGRAEQLAAAGR